jgi:hypothetical protein
MWYQPIRPYEQLRAVGSKLPADASVNSETPVFFGSYSGAGDSFSSPGTRIPGVLALLQTSLCCTVSGGPGLSYSVLHCEDVKDLTNPFGE